MVTRLSFAGTTSGIGGRVPPRKVACSVMISLQENRDLPHSVTGMFEVHRMDLVLHFGKEENVLRRCDHQCIDCFHWEVNLVYNSERPM